MALEGWENFYVIVGSSAGALIGLQFVVITLVAQSPVARDMQRATSAFATPTIIHFASVLLLSAVVCAPWHALAGPAILWGVLGLVGIVYEVVVVRRMRVQTAYQPEFEDWSFHVLLPCVAYATLAVSACVVPVHPGPALFSVGGAALLLLFIGIHNAWDGVTYHVFIGKGRSKEAGE
jgi:hypothetical protein